MVEPYLNETSLEDALQEKQIYIVNLEVLDGIACRDCRTVSRILPRLNLFNPLVP